jgi:hypothetical protein
MHCWEFHHRVEGNSYQWYWRALTAEGKIHGESAARFDTFLQALEDAKKNGFNQELLSLPEDRQRSAAPRAWRGEALKRPAPQRPAISGAAGPR